MKLSIIIINYNTFDMTCNCIKSIYDRNFLFKFEIILVDNASGEKDANEFKIIFPDIKLIINSSNSGFARGNNLGLEASSGEYLLLLNSDTLIEQNAVEYCLDFMDQPGDNQKVGLVGCKLCYADGGPQLSSFDHKVGLWSTLIDNPIMHAIRTRLGLVKSYTYWIDKQEKRHYTQALLGAYMLCRKSVIAEIGMLDPDFFMYFEEFEWCYRITDASYKIQYLPEVQITHFYGATSTNKNNLAEHKINKQSCLSRMLLIYKRSGKLGLFLFNGIWYLNKLTIKVMLVKYSRQQLAGQLAAIDGFDFARKYQRVMIENYNSSYGSSGMPFSLPHVLDLSSQAKVTW